MSVSRRPAGSDGSAVRQQTREQSKDSSSNSDCSRRTRHWTAGGRRHQTNRQTNEQEKKRIEKRREPLESLIGSTEGLAHGMTYDHSKPPQQLFYLIKHLSLSRWWMPKSPLRMFFFFLSFFPVPIAIPRHHRHTAAALPSASSFRILLPVCSLHSVSRRVRPVGGETTGLGIGQTGDGQSSEWHKPGTSVHQLWQRSGRAGC